MILAVVLIIPVPVSASVELLNVPLYHDAVLLMGIGYFTLVVALSHTEDVIFADTVGRAVVELV